MYDTVKLELMPLLPVTEIVALYDCPRVEPARVTAKVSVPFAAIESTEDLDTVKALVLSLATASVPVAPDPLFLIVMVAAEALGSA